MTALQPGPTDTSFFSRANMLDTKVGADKKDDPADVARDGFEALMAGKDHVVAGAFKNKVRVDHGAGDPRQGHRRDAPQALRARLGVQGQGPRSRGQPIIR